MNYVDLPVSILTLVYISCIKWPVLTCSKVLRELGLFIAVLCKFQLPA